MKKASYVIVGGGLPSLLFAYLLSKRNPSKTVLIIETSNQVGGLFKSTQNKSGDIFDQGMHIYYETGIEDIDQAFLGILPDQEWNFLVGNRKDIAGIYYNGRLQLDTPYPDLRGQSDEKKIAFIQSLFQPIDKPNRENPQNVSELLINHFGEMITEEVFEPILKKLYNLSGEKIDTLASKLTAIDRVALYGEDIVEDLMKSDYIRARIAYPDQLRLPYKRESNLRGVYPKKFGFGKVIEKLTLILEESGVLFLFNARVKELVFEENRISYLIVNDEKETRIKIDDGIIWSADIFSLLKSINENVESKLKIEQKRYVNIILKHYPKMGELYYFYNFDAASEIFRVTNFSSYCPDASKEGRYPICVEYWSKDPLTEDQITSNTIADLLKMAVISDSESIISAEVSRFPILFPTPSIDAINSLNEASKVLDQNNIENLVLTGALSSKNVFFLHEVLKSGYDSLCRKGWI